MTFGDAVLFAGGVEPITRAALLHLLWTHEVEADLSQPLSDATLLTARVSS